MAQGFKKTRWTSLIELDPRQAKKELEKALKKADGNVTQLGRELELSRETLYKYFVRLGIEVRR